MNIGSLFLSLGIKGTEKTVGALSNVKKGLSDTASLSLEAKAGILAAMYAMERLFAASGAAGTGLTNFNSLTGLSTGQLQKWQFAARQAGVSNDEFAGSLKAVQTGMTNMLMGKGAPEGLAMLANKVGFDPKRARDTFYVMEQLQKFAKTVPNDIGNAVMKSFGVSEGTIAAMRRNAFSPQTMANAPVYTDKEIGALDQANIAWSNLGNKIEMAVGHFNAAHGGEIVGQISQIVDAVLKLTEAFITLGEKLKIFDALGQVAGLVAPTLQAASRGVETLGGAVTDPKKRKQLIEDVKGYKMPTTGGFNFKPAAVSGAKFDPNKLMSVPSGAITSKSIVPPMKGGPATGGKQQNINVVQNLHFQHDGKDAKKTSDSVKKANQDAYRQFPQGQVN